MRERMVSKMLISKTESKKIKMSKKKKQYPENKEDKQPEKPKAVIEISQTKSDVESFLKKFRSDVAKKRKAYQQYRSNIEKRKPSK